jgi:hypothetical protein
MVWTFWTTAISLASLRVKPQFPGLADYSLATILPELSQLP